MTFYYSLSEPVTEFSPVDGEVTVLPRSVWRQQLAFDYDNPHADDFLYWEQEHYAWGPRRTAKGLSGSPVADCPDCLTTAPKKVYCGLHRCRGTWASGSRCQQPASESNGLMYCRRHQCQQDLGRQGLWCSEPAGTD